ncbi:sucrase ferredoxin [Kribbella sp. CA-253562]|uniref:sucrase ferredoxin n=1 Tax=Kribbella sp. CA-253562 TaxID=3239942 RepID=UPI003D91B58F
MIPPEPLRPERTEDQRAARSSPVASQRPGSPVDSRYRPETGCAASAERRGDELFASAPPAERWLLIELNAPWPRVALTALHRSAPQPTAPSAAQPPTADLPTQLAQLCTKLRCRPVLIRRHGRLTAGTPRRWFLVDSRPGHESIRTGELPTDGHLLAVLTGADPGTPSTDPIYLVCTHGRHDACCAVRGRPAAAALTAAYPDRTWECSHIGGDRFAANLVFLPHSLFYGHVPADQAVPLAQSYDQGRINPTYYRGSGALSPAVQAAQHFARRSGHSTSLDALQPVAVRGESPDLWSITLATSGDSPTSTPATPAGTNPAPDAASPRHGHTPLADTKLSAAGTFKPTGSSEAGSRVTVEVRSEIVTVDGQMTCAARPPGRFRRFRLLSVFDE